jgi:hypothetical protein
VLTEAEGPAVTTEAQPRHRLARPRADSPLVSGALISVTRVVVGLLVSRLALTVFPVRGFPLAPGTEAVGGTAGLFSWDAFFYKSIATVGYPHNQPAWAAFFPLYAELARAVDKVTGAGYDKSALAVSWLSLFFATWGLIRLAARVWPDLRARSSRAGWLLCFFPASVFLIAGYAESTYIALFVWALVALWERRPWLAAVGACLAGLTRPEGAFIGLSVVLWSLMQAPSPQGGRRWVRTAGLAVVSWAGFVAFSIFLWVRFHDPLQEFRAEKYWGRQATWPFHPLVWSVTHMLRGEVTGPGAANVTAVYLLDDAAVVFATAAVVALVALARRNRDLWWVLLPALIEYVSVICNGPVHGGSPESDARFVLCLTPLLLWPVRWRRERIWTGLIVTCAAFAVVFQAIFNLGGWLT